MGSRAPPLECSLLTWCNYFVKMSFPVWPYIKELFGNLEESSEGSRYNTGMGPFLLLQLELLISD